MRPRIVALVATAALAVAAPTAQSLAQPSRAPHVAVAAKTCSAGYTHAVIGGQQKCLRRGEYCAKRYKKQYRHYGYRCVKAKGAYRLE
jgi:hypothetical protein